MANNEDAPAPPAAPAPFAAAHSLEAALKLWNEVERGVWKEAGDVGPDYDEGLRSLESAHYYARSSADARAFIDKNLSQIVYTLLMQEPGKLDDHEKDCIEKTLIRSLRIIVEDLDRNDLRIDDNGISVTLDALVHIFRESQTYDSKSRPVGSLRRRMITQFQHMHGFRHLIAYLNASRIAYLNARANSSQFPDLLAFDVLQAIHDIMPRQREMNETLFDPSRGEAWEMTQLVMKHLSDNISLYENSARDDAQEAGRVGDLLRLLNRICCKLSEFPQDIHLDLAASFSFWRSLTLTMMHSESREVRLSGWDQIDHLVRASEKMQPPPRAYVVEGAGTDFINGRYELSSDMITELGYAISLGRRNDLLWWQYHRQVPNDCADSDRAGKTITLFRCVMRSQMKWWFLSEPDKDQPGTDKDIDYYQHKSSKKEERLPSLSGWLTCRAGQDPAPTLKSVGLMVPRGEEESTSGHLLAKWAIENNLVELALGDSTTEEIVAKATALVQYLARMCSDTFAGPQKYCLQASHLSFASQSIERTMDAMTLAQMHLLLLTIRESLPEGLKEMVPPIAKSATLRRIELNDPTLLTLQLGRNYALAPREGEVGVFDPVNGSDCERLGHSIATNTHLEVVQLDGTIGVNSTITDVLFRGLKQNSSIKSLEMEDCDISRAAGAGIVTAFRERNAKVLERISLINCAMGNGGSPVLASTLRACTSLREISLPGNGIVDDELADIIPAIGDHSQLVTLRLSENRIEKVDPLADLLSNPQCNLVTIELGNNRINSAGAIMLARSLAQNRKLVKLNLASNGRIVWGEELFEAFLKSICDTKQVSMQPISPITPSRVLGFELVGIIVYIVTFN